MQSNQKHKKRLKPKLQALFMFQAFQIKRIKTGIVSESSQCLSIFYAILPSCLRKSAYMGLRSGEMISVASVTAWTSSTVNSGLISVITRPLSVTSSTHISVMILVTQCTAV